MSEELKPCPMCGGSAYDDTESAKIFGNQTGHEYAIACSWCETKGPGHSAFQAAVDAWNTRHIPEGFALVPLEPTREMVEALRDAIAVTSRGGVLRAGIALKASIAAAQAQPE